MSSVVKTLTPFLNRELLVAALKEVGCLCTVSGDEIATNRQDYQGRQRFVFADGRFAFVHDSDAIWRGSTGAENRSVATFLSEVETAYNVLYQRKLVELERLRLEDERRQLERERQAYVEKVKITVRANAKAKGYDIREEAYAGKIKLILVRNVY
jgi:hypothetical protein